MLTYLLVLMLGLVALWVKRVDNHKIEDLGPELKIIHGITIICTINRITTSTLVSMIILHPSYHLWAKGRIVVLKILSYNGVPV